MTDLVAFLRTRYDEEEAAAKAAGAETEGTEWVADLDAPYEEFPSAAGCQFTLDGRLEVSRDVVCFPATAVHVALNDPARVLREVEAKRKILDLYDANGGQWIWALRALAAVYSDHPDYDPAWSA